MTDSPDLIELLAGCENQVLHRTDQVQPFAFLVRCTADGLISHLSASIAHYLPLEAGTLIGGSIHALIDAETLDELTHRTGGFLEARLHNQRFDLAAHADADAWIIEANPVASAAQLPPDGAALGLINGASDERDLQACLDELAANVREVTGFDRVTLYRFADDWSGEVVAESSDGRLPSYLGLHFPASDIPEPARLLYLKHPWRLIVDVNTRPEAVLSNRADARLDLARCDLRAVAPVHLEYLRNMGVQASFSASILVQGRLWGLVACHHAEPRYLAYPLRQLCHHLTRGFVMRLLALQAQARIGLVESIDRTTEDLTRRLIAIGPGDGDGVAHEIAVDLLKMVGADAAFFVSAEGLQSFGPDLDPQELSFLDEWFMGLDEELMASDQIHAQCPWLGLPAEKLSGLLAVRTPYRDADGELAWLRFYWLRKQQAQHLRWAGAPEKTAEIDPESGIAYLSPRRSFAEWRELKHGFSAPWTSADLLTAKKFRGNVLRWLSER